MPGRDEPTPPPRSTSEDDTTIVREPASASEGARVRAASAPMPRTIGRYTILGRLGEGGMGIVFEAEQEQPRRRVALKVIRGGQFVDDERIRLFQREVDTLARLRHPNIAAIYEAGRTESGEHFFAMELVRGRTLDDFMALRQGPLDEAEIRFRLRMFLTLLGAVSYAHQRGVIHRDLKPSNIIVPDAAGPGASSSASAMPDLKVLDFGLARITASDVDAMTMLSEIGAIRGTLAYMSPEQVRGETDRIDVRSDVYTLGVILQEILTGKRPYDVRSLSLIEAARMITEQSPLPLAKAWKGVRPPDSDLQTIVEKALEKDADRRYPSVAALEDDVERYLGSRPILARAPSTMYQLRKLAKRHRALFAGTAVAGAALLIGIVASTTFGIREAVQRRAAEQAQRDTHAMVEFQADMLGGVDARRMGRRLAEDLADRVAEAHRASHATPAEAEAARRAFAAEMARVNTTDAALRVIDENILAQAVTTSATRFADRPRLEAQLLGSIGETYFKLGLLERADTTLERALPLFGPARGRDPGALATTRALADVYAAQGRAGEAESLYTLAIAGQRRALGTDHPDYLQSLDGLAVLDTDAERYPAAESLYAIVLPAMRRVKGVEDPRTISVLSNYAWALISNDKYAEAESLAVLAVALDRKVLGSENPQTMDAVNNLGVLYVRSGRPQLAEPLYVEDLATSRRLLGSEHPDVLVSMTNLGRLYNRLQKFGQAEAILREAVVTTRKVMPPGFIGLGISLLAHSEALVGLERHREAEPDALEAYKILTALRPGDDPGVQRAVKVLVTVYENTGRPDAVATWKGRLTAAK